MIGCGRGLSLGTEKRKKRRGKKKEMNFIWKGACMP